MVCAAPILKYIVQTATQISDRQQYIDVILKTDQNNQVISVQPFSPDYLPETKYAGESTDIYANYIPYLIHRNTLEGEHISPNKQQQIQQQQDANRLEHLVPAEIKPMEP